VRGGACAARQGLHAARGAAPSLALTSTCSAAPVRAGSTAPTPAPSASPRGLPRTHCLCHLDCERCRVRVVELQVHDGHKDACEASAGVVAAGGNLSSSTRVGTHGAARVSRSAGVRLGSPGQGRGRGRRAEGVGKHRAGALQDEVGEGRKKSCPGWPRRGKTPKRQHRQVRRGSADTLRPPTRPAPTVFPSHPVQRPTRDTLRCTNSVSMRARLARRCKENRTASTSSCHSSSQLKSFCA
jgi:hypothetical protein